MALHLASKKLQGQHQGHSQKSLGTKLPIPKNSDAETGVKPVTSWRWGQNFSDVLLAALSNPTFKMEESSTDWTTVLGFAIVQKS